MRGSIVRKRLVRVSLLLVPVMLLGVFVGATGSATGAQSSNVTTSSLGEYSPTYVGPASDGCASGCSLLTGPNTLPATSGQTSPVTPPGTSSTIGRSDVMSGPGFHYASRKAAVDDSATSTGTPSVSCQPQGPGCDSVSSSSGGATGVKGLNAVDSAENTTNIYKDVEPPDQGLCAGNGYIVETNNIGEILVFNTALQRESTPISLDTVMGLTGKGWSSGGDPSCEYDPSNGGHFFFTEIVSASPESNGGAFVGCFAAVANSCYEGIAVTKGASPLGPYNVYYANADYNPNEPGYPSLLNDFAKIGVTRDAFEMFYDEFPLGYPSVPGFGGGFFNGAQEFAFDKTALEQGLPASDVNVAIENMGKLRTPDGTCIGSSGLDCWAAVIPAQPADAQEFDNSYDGSGFMMDSLDFKSFYGGIPTTGDDRIAVWDWTGLAHLDSNGCSTCGAIRFGGQLFSGVDRYNDPENGNSEDIGFLGTQKRGPIPLGDECGAAGLSTGSSPPASCPEGGIETNGDFMTEVSQAQGQLWAPLTTEIKQVFGSYSVTHEGAVYYVIDTKSFDWSKQFSLTNQGYVAAAHNDMEFPAIAGEGSGGNGGAIMDFTVNGRRYYPSTGYGRLTAYSSGLTGSTINIADMGQSPQDGFTEYQGYPGPTRPRWGDYSWAIYLPGSGGRIYFANNYIQYPSCTGSAFTLTVATCGGTRDGMANWGTSVNYVVP